MISLPDVVVESMPMSNALKATFLLAIINKVDDVNPGCGQGGKSCYNNRITFSQ
jgi:hypothetical protein